MIETERELFIRELQELYHIERELEGIQSSLAESATDEELEEFYMSHSEATTEQIARLEDLFDAIRAEPDRRESAPLQGILDERDSLVQDVEDPNLGDRIDAETGRAIERLEITKLETLIGLADRLDLGTPVAEPLSTTKTEAENAVETLREYSAV